MSVDRGHKKEENTYKNFTRNTDACMRYNFTPQKFMVGEEIIGFQKNKEVSRKTKGNLYSSVGNISGSFHIQAN